ncbi:hypothetical protein [Dyella psychrodurans]|uniref:Uncharacterized protein n=1 Tax=Dyella psychrodurans TaxID=1927960 RepID=A0A370XEK2_9GAMM|nr:hypothetical protein [Dyella psychrodurans]RDS86675.1 hypothetical protein DWU99_05450 [Dyella psychrodurans]
MATTGHLFEHAGHRFYYTLTIDHQGLSAHVTCDGKALNRFHSPFSGHGASHDKVLMTCKRLVEVSIRENRIKWH